MKTAVFWAVCGLCAALPAQIVPAPPQAKPFVLRGVTVHPGGGAAALRADVVVTGGRIAAVAPQAAVPAGAVVVDAAGKHLYPAMISANSALGLVEIEAVRATRDYAEVGDFTPEVRAETAVQADSELFPVTRANGVLLALVVPGGGLLSGTSALLALDGWTGAEMVVKAPVAMHLRWPHWSPGPEKDRAKRRKAYSERLGRLADLFSEAKAYAVARAAFAAGRGPAPRHDRRLAALAPVVAGELPLFVHADRRADIEAAVNFALRWTAKVVLVGGRGTARAIPFLKRHGVPVVVASILRLPGRRDAPYDELYTLPKKLHDAGIQFCLARSGGPGAAANERNLPYEAAMAAAFGLDPQVAYDAVSLYPARILGVAGRLGTIAKGKDATMILCDGDPLDVRSHVLAAWIEGRRLDLDSRHERLRRKYAERLRRAGKSPAPVRKKRKE